MAEDQYSRFKSLTYEGFRKLAGESSLSRHEKIGFPNSYREGYEERIHADIETKLSRLGRKRQTVLDIGPGCSRLPEMLIDVCRRQDHTLILADSPEMLAYLPDEPFIQKLPGQYPQDSGMFLDAHAGKINVILTYSVFHYIFAEGGVFDFVDRSLALLAPGGQMLIGDIPNKSKRNRFFSSEAGIRFHQQFTGTNEVPHVTFNALERGEIDDAVVLAIVMRCRSAGFDAYVVPQACDLPMANRREDILITRP